MADTEQKKVLTIDTGQAITSVRDLKNRLRELKDVLVSTEQGTEEYNKAMQEAANLQHDFRETMTEMNSRAQDFGQVMSNCTKAVTGIVGAVQSANAVMTLMGAESEETAEAIKKMQASMALIQGLASFEEGIKAVNRLLPKLLAGTKAQTVAQKALNVALQPKVVVALAAAIAAVTIAYNALTKSSREAKKAQEEQQKAIDEIGRAGSDVVGKFKVLKNSYETLKTTAEKNTWIKQHASDFSSLGLAVKGTNEADQIFIQQSESVIKALKARAIATAAQTKYSQEYGKAEDQVIADEQEEAETLEKITEGYRLSEGDVKKFGLTWKDYQRTVIDVGASHVEERKATEATITAIKKYYDNLKKSRYEAVDDSYGKIFEEAERAAMDAEGAVSQFFKTTTDKTTTKKAKDEVTDVFATLKTEYEKNLASLVKDTSSEYSKLVSEKAQKMSALETMRVMLGMDDDTYDALKKGIEDKYKKLIDAALKPDEDEEEVDDDDYKKLEELVKSYHDTFDTEREKLTKEYQANVKILDDMEASSLISHETYLEKKLKLDRQYKQESMAIEMERLTEAADSMTLYANILTNFGSAMDETNEKEFEAAKAFNISAAVINTITGALNAYTGAVGNTGLNAIPVVGPAIAQATGVAAALAVTASGIAQIKQISQQKFGSASVSGSSIGSVSSSAVTSLNSPVAYTQDVQGADIQSSITDSRVYVVESDITNTQKKVSVAQSENRY